VVGVDGFEVELDAERLLAFRHDLGAQHLIGSGHEIGPAQPMQSGRLGVSRCPPRSQDRCDSSAARGDCAGPGKLQKSPSIETPHNLSSLLTRVVNSPLSRQMFSRYSPDSGGGCEARIAPSGVLGNRKSPASARGAEMLYFALI